MESHDWKNQSLPHNLPGLMLLQDNNQLTRNSSCPTEYTLRTESIQMKAL